MLSEYTFSTSSSTEVGFNLIFNTVGIVFSMGRYTKRAIKGGFQVVSLGNRVSQENSGSGVVMFTQLFHRLLILVMF